MDEHLAQLDHRVAAAAQAWVTDARDTAVYARLIAALEIRRAYLNPQLPEPDVSGPPAGDPDVAEVLDDLAAGDNLPQTVGASLGPDTADIADVLERLRRP